MNTGSAERIRIISDLITDWHTKLQAMESDSSDIILKKHLPKLYHGLFYFASSKSLSISLICNIWNIVAFLGAFSSCKYHHSLWILLEAVFLPLVLVLFHWIFVLVWRGSVLSKHNDEISSNSKNFVTILRYTLAVCNDDISHLSHILQVPRSFMGTMSYVFQICIAFFIVYILCLVFFVRQIYSYSNHCTQIYFLSTLGYVPVFITICNSGSTLFFCFQIVKDIARLLHVMINKWMERYKALKRVRLSDLQNVLTIGNDQDIELRVVDMPEGQVPDDNIRGLNVNDITQFNELHSTAAGRSKVVDESRHTISMQAANPAVRIHASTMAQRLRRDAFERYLIILNLASDVGTRWSLLVLTSLVFSFLLFLWYFLYTVFILKFNHLEESVPWMVIAVIVFFYPIWWITYANLGVNILKSEFTCSVPRSSNSIFQTALRPESGSASISQKLKANNILVDAALEDYDVIGGRQEWLEYINAAPVQWAIFGVVLTPSFLQSLLLGATTSVIAIMIPSILKFLL